VNVAVDTARTLEGLALLEARILAAAALSVRAGVEAAEKAAKGTVLWKDRTTNTRSSIHGDVAGGFVTAGGASKFLENGTSDHNGKPVMRFVINGEVLFRRRVRGIKATHFMAEAAHIGEMAMVYAAEMLVGEAIQSAR
jgi:hypothetical protein